MPIPSVLAINSLRVSHVKWPENFMKTFFCKRNCHQVHMVSHQAISQDFNLMFVSVLFKPSEIAEAILVIKKHSLTPISTLSDMVR
jgi:hypothetical protein